MAVGDYDILPFSGPAEPMPLAQQVRGNDETLRAKFVAHQDDTEAHIVQQAAVADASGGTVVDSEARTAINDLLSRLRDAGIIAT